MEKKLGIEIGNSSGDFLPSADYEVVARLNRINARKVFANNGSDKTCKQSLMLAATE
jgi:hypothetical protein